MKKKILVIDDSALMRRVISDIINSDSEFEVIKIARNGEEGYELMASDPSMYDVVVMDINMPKMTGLEVLEKLQKNNIKIAIIIASTLAKEGAAETIRALELGAFDFITKPEGGLVVRDDSFKDKLLAAVRLASGVNKSRLRMSSEVSATSAPAVKHPARFRAGSTDGRIHKIVALACSTGGPKSLQSVIPKLPANLDAPVLLVQHMPKGFTASLAQRLDSLSRIHVKEAEDDEIVTKGTVYIAQGGKHLKIRKDASGNFRIVIDDSPAVDALRPCANLMYNSLEEVNVDEITCVVLTGMGADGTKGITSLSRKKKVYVISQDEATCVVYGMPKAIYESGIVDEVCPLDAIADAITNNVGVS